MASHPWDMLLIDVIVASHACDMLLIDVKVASRPSSQRPRNSACNYLRQSSVKAESRLLPIPRDSESRRAAVCLASLSRGMGGSLDGALTEL